MKYTNIFYVIVPIVLIAIFIFVRMRKEQYVSMPAAYITQGVKQIACEGPQLFLNASRLPSDAWNGVLVNDKGELYVGKAENPYVAVKTTKLVKAFVDKDNTFHCYYNTTAPNTQAHLFTQIFKDRKTRPNSSGDGVIVSGPGKETGVQYGEGGRMLQPPWSYDPKDFEEELVCPNVSTVQFTAQRPFRA